MNGYISASGTGFRKSKGYLGLQLLLKLVFSLLIAVSNDVHRSENILRRYKLTIFHALFGSRP